LLGHRFYDPATARFLNRDPIGTEGGYNLYRYSENNPINLMDPGGNEIEWGEALKSGMEWCKSICGIRKELREPCKRTPQEMAKSSAEVVKELPPVSSRLASLWSGVTNGWSELGSGLVSLSKIATTPLFVGLDSMASVVTKEKQNCAGCSRQQFPEANTSGTGNWFIEKVVHFFGDGKRKDGGILPDHFTDDMATMKMKKGLIQEALGN